MAKWRVTAKISGRKRTRTTKYWLKKKNAQRYADETNKYRPGANARVVKG